MSAWASNLFVFTRVLAKDGRQQAVIDAIQEVICPTRQEFGCLMIEAFTSTDNSRLFYIHSRWRDEAAFDDHLGFPHTLRFLSDIKTLLHQPMEVTRAELVTGDAHLVMEPIDELSY